jgi:hypothetical protein
VTKDSIYLLPKDFQGVVVILNDQKNGQQPKYEGSARTYEIPANGILRTRFDGRLDWHTLDRFYHLNNGRRIEIMYDNSENSVKGNKIRACCFASGSATTYINDTIRSVQYVRFYVATEKTIDSILQAAKKINPVDLLND